jgi:RNA polymerase sigma-70 factor, ECF subfamily
MPNIEPKTSLLLNQWYEGHTEALEQLIAKHLDWIHRKAHECMTPMLRARMETGDLAQEAILRFLAGAPTFSIEDGKRFRGLLLAIVINAMREESRWWQAKRRDLRREIPIPSGTVLDLQSPMRNPASLAAERESLVWILYALEILNAADRQVLVMKQYDDMNNAEIGAQLGISREAVGMRYTRGKRRLKEIVECLRRGDLPEDLEDIREMMGDQDDPDESSAEPEGDDGT